MLFTGSIHTVRTTLVAFADPGKPAYSARTTEHITGLPPKVTDSCRCIAAVRRLAWSRP